MEVPEFCRRASQRIAKKRKTEEELDPDYQPEIAKGPVAAASKIPKPSTSRGTTNNAAAPASYNSRAERKKVRRSRTLAEELRKPTPGLQFIERNEYSIEDWKKKAAQVHKNRILETANEMADVLKDADFDRLTGFEYPVQEILHHGSNNPYSRYVEPGGVSAELEEFEFDYNNLPNYVMGTGKGTAGGPPEWEFKTLWHYELTPIQPDQVNNDDSSLMPWTKKDATEPDLTPDILSIAASLSVGCILDLKMIAMGSRNIEYNPERFAPLIMRLREPKSTALIFGSGKLIVAGTRSEEECRHACRKYARLISKFGFRARVCNFEIQNISASCSLKFRVRVNQLCKNRLFGPLSYEPEIFPGLVIPLEYPKIKIIVFATGSVLMTGGKSEADVQLAFKKIYPLVRMYAP